MVYLILTIQEEVVTATAITTLMKTIIVATKNDSFIKSKKKIQRYTYCAMVWFGGFLFKRNYHQREFNKAKKKL